MHSKNNLALGHRLLSPQSMLFFMLLDTTSHRKKIILRRQPEELGS